MSRIEKKWIPESVNSENESSRDLSGDMVCPGFVQREMRYQSDKVLYEIGFWSSIMYCFGPENDPNLYSACFYQISTRPAFTKSLLDLLLPNLYSTCF